MKTAWTAMFASACFLAVLSSTQLAESTTPAHHGENRFRNPYIDQFTSSRFFRYIQARYFSEKPFADYAGQSHLVPRSKVDQHRLHFPPPDTPQVTWIGHASVLIQYQGVNLLTDPIFSRRASPFSFIGPVRHTPAALTIEQLPQIDYVVISHNHYDHLDAATVDRIGNVPKWIVPMGVKDWFVSRNIDPDRVVELDWYQEWALDNVQIIATPAQHFSGRTLWDHSKTLWCSWAIRIGRFNAWFGGDTGYNPIQFKRIGAELGPFHLGLIPIGAYAPRWFMKPVHVDPEEAVELHKDVRAWFSIGVHWGAFQLSAEPIDAPKRELERAARAAGVDFTTLAIGETHSIDLNRGLAGAPEPSWSMPAGSQREFSGSPFGAFSRSGTGS